MKHLSALAIIAIFTLAIPMVSTAPTNFAGASVLGDISGKYMTTDRHAELEIEQLPDGNVHVKGFAMWHDHTGILDFKAPIKNGTVTFTDEYSPGKAYMVELSFHGSGINVDENIKTLSGIESYYGMGYHGMNVTFFGEYHRARPGEHSGDPCLMSIPRNLGHFPDEKTLTMSKWQDMMFALDDWRKAVDPDEYHERWYLSDAPQAPPQSIFNGIVLTDARLSCGPGMYWRPQLIKAGLTGADFSGSDMRFSELDSADMNGAVLRKTILEDSSAKYTNFTGADLTGVSFSSSDLSNAILEKTILVNADLTYVDLSYAEIIDADITNTDMFSANLKGTVFEPLASSLPPVKSIAFANGLKDMRFRNNPQAMEALKVAFRESGLREQELQVTYAIEHTKRLLARESGLKGRIESAFKFVFFELSCEYGNSPGRALLALFLMMPLFAVPYIVSLRIKIKDGIWRVWSDERLRKDLGNEDIGPLNVGSGRAVLLGLYFSVLSAFHIGWRDLNVGNWIARIQPREYSLRASGWVRTISGIQSLISVYLLAIWALSYFGRPFG